MLFRSDRKSTRLNSSHTIISYAVFCLKKKTSRSSAGYDPASARSTRQSTPHRRHAPTKARAAPRPAAREVAGDRSVLGYFFLKNGPPPEIPALPQHSPLPI